MQTSRQLQAYSGLPMLGSGNQESESKFVERCQKRMRDSDLEGRMPGVINQPERGLTAPCLGKAMRRHRRADHVVAALDDVGRKMPDDIDMLHDVIRRQEAVIDEIMRFETRHADS